MSGRLVYEVATLVSAVAEEKLTAAVEDDDNPKMSYRSALLLALVASEREKGTSKEELIAALDTFYDLVHGPEVKPPMKRTKSSELRLALHN